MKKIFNLLAVVAVALSFTACHPLDNTYKQLGDLPAPGNPVIGTTVTLTNADYNLLPTSNYAKTSFNFKTLDDAKASIPVILAAKYPTYTNNSSVSVTFNNGATGFKPADSLFNNIRYTVVESDYVDGADVVGNKNTAGTTIFRTYNNTQVLNFLGWKYPAKTPNQLVLLTYQYFESGATPSAGITTTDSFVYVGGQWVKAYTISAAQYASVGRSTNGNFGNADFPQLQGWFNTFLKTDPTIANWAKAGDVRYVSYKYFASNVNYQRVLPLTYDGTNWLSTPPATLLFAKTNNAWIADNTVRYTLVKDNYTFISNIPNIASANAVTNLKSFSNFALTGVNKWEDVEVNNGIIAVLKDKYQTGEQEQKFIITFTAYNGSTVTLSKTFVYRGTNFVIQP